MTIAMDYPDAMLDPVPSPPPPSGIGARDAGGLMRQGIWAIADQGLFAGANCVLNVMLARWLSPTDYGAFSTAFAAFLALGVIHTALLTEPMLVFSPDRYRHDHKHYFGALVHGHVLVSLAASVVLAAAGLFLARHGQAQLAQALYCFAAAGPFILFLWLMRRACYGQFNARRAAMGGMGYLLIMMTSLVLVHRLGTLSIATAMLMIGGSSLVVGALLAVGKLHLRTPGPLLRDVAAEHLRYGRWAVATQLLGFIPGNIYYFLLPSMATLDQSGALRALSNLFMPLLQGSAALCLLLLPAYVAAQGTPEGKRLHRLALLVLGGGPLVYWLAMGLFHRQVMQLVYGGKYLDYSPLIWVLGLQPVISGLGGVYGSLLRARQKLNAVFYGGLMAAAAAVVLGVGLTRQFAMAGVCWSTVITYMLNFLTLWLFSRRIAGTSERAAAAVLPGLAEPA